MLDVERPWGYGSQLIGMSSCTIALLSMHIPGTQQILINHIIVDLPGDPKKGKWADFVSENHQYFFTSAWNS